MVVLPAGARVTPDEQRRFDRLEARVDQLAREVQDLKTERTMRVAERHYRALGRDKEAPGAALGVASCNIGSDGNRNLVEGMLGERKSK